jgi:hypothetical protein
MEKKESKREKISHDEPFSKINKSATKNIAYKRKAAQVELAFWEAIALSIELFRKSGTLWVETTLA